MIKSERDKTRDARKFNILNSFENDEPLFTNQIAKKIGIVWPVADKLLQELVEEKRLSGDKIIGYRPYKEENPSLLDRFKKLIHA